jgi:hypothetical protein
MDQDDDLVMNAYVRSKLGIGLPPRRQVSGMIDRKTLTDKTGEITSVSNSLFEFDMGLDERKIEEALDRAGSDLDSMIDNIDTLKERLKRLKTN